MIPSIPNTAIMLDTSKHNGLFDPTVAVAQGVRVHAGRLTVGNYYVDPMGLINFDAGAEAGLIETFYLVIAPEFNALDHIAWYKKQKAGRKPMRGTILDVELTRNQSPGRISSVVQDVAKGVADDEGEEPFIYTRESWWDISVAQWSGWQKYKLIAARYNTYLTSPWSDGYYKFRDWDDWAGWQCSADGNGLGHTYGCTEVDIDISIIKLGAWGLKPLPTLVERVARLEELARAAGWEV